MCLPLSDATMRHWLHQQVRMVEAWREALAARPELDIAAARRVERHYQWLTREAARLEDAGVDADAAADEPSVAATSLPPAAPPPAEVRLSL